MVTGCLVTGCLVTGSTGRVDPDLFLHSGNPRSFSLNILPRSCGQIDKKKTAIAQDRLVQAKSVLLKLRSRGLECIFFLFFFFHRLTFFAPVAGLAEEGQDKGRGSIRELFHGPLLQKSECPCVLYKLAQAPRDTDKIFIFLCSKRKSQPSGALRANMWTCLCRMHTSCACSLDYLEYKTYLFK